MKSAIKLKKNPSKPEKIRLWINCCWFIGSSEHTLMFIVLIYWKANWKIHTRTNKYDRATTQLSVMKLTSRSFFHNRIYVNFEVTSNFFGLSYTLRLFFHEISLNYCSETIHFNFWNYFVEYNILFINYFVESKLQIHELVWPVVLALRVVSAN